MFRERDTPRLIFTPRAWLKWQFLCHAGPTEVGAFGLSHEGHPYLMEDLLVIKQSTTPVSVAFDDLAVAELFEEMVDAGVPPHRFARVWLHTHPGASVDPSGVDEETFRRVFGRCDWAIMAILGRTGRTSARLRFNVGPGGAMEIPIAVDWSEWPEYATSHQFFDEVDLWQTEFDRLIEPRPIIPKESAKSPAKPAAPNPLAAGFDEALFGDFEYFTPRTLDEYP